MDLKNVVAISCRTNTGEMFEVPVREFFGLDPAQSSLGIGVVPKSDGKSFIASDVTEGANGQLTFKNYKSETSFTGIPVGILAFDANGRIVTVPFQQNQTPTKTTTQENQSSSVQSTTNKLPIWTDNNGGLGDSDITRDGDSYSVGGTMPFWKWDVYQGSVNITQSSINDGFRINGKLVVSYDPDSEELTIGNSVYTTTNIKFIKTDSITWNASGGGSITDVAAATTGNYTLTKPAKDGTYALLSDITDTAWLLNGNALTEEKSLGSASGNFDIPIIRNGAAIATIKSTGLQLDVLAAESTDVDKFLVSNAGLIKYRTGTQLLGDIGGFSSPSGLTTGTVPRWNGSAFIDSSITDSGSVVTVPNILVSGLTASQLVATDASKNLVSLSTATYPSLTEVSYIKGLTSSVQTQINGKQPLDADLTAIAAISATSGLLKKTATDTWGLDTSVYITGNETITLSGVVTGSGTTAITTAIADSALSIAKTSGLQTALDSKQENLSGTGFVKSTAGIISYDTSVYITGNETIALSGIVTGSGATAITTAIADNALTIAKTSGLQSALDLKANLSGPTFTGSVVLPSTTSIGTVSSTEIGYLDGVTSAIQTQINGKFATPTGLTTNYVTKWNGTALANSLLFDNGSRIGISQATPLLSFEVNNATGNTYSRPSIGGRSADGTLWGYMLSPINSGTFFDIIRSNNLGLRFATESSLGGGTFTTQMFISSGGSVGIGTTSLTGYSLRNAKTITGATTSYAQMNDGVVQSGVTTEANYVMTTVGTQATSFTLPTLNHFRAMQGTFGAGSTVTNQVGFLAGSTLTGATNNYGFRGQISSGTNRWNNFHDGTAQNHFRGNVGIGSGTTTPSHELVVAGTTQTTNLKITASATVGKYWVCTNADGTGAWTALGSSGYLGTWNPSTNTPTIADGTGTAGTFYIATATGTWNSITFAVNDQVWYNGTIWEKVTVGTTIPTATASVLGGIKVGSGLSIDSGTGVLSVATLNQNTTGSAATLTSPRNIALSGDATWSVSFNGSADVTSALTLATVNSNIGTFAGITVNGKGLVTGATALTTLSGYGITDAQPLNTSLTNLAALAVSTGIMVQTTGDGQFVVRSLTGTTDRISVSNGNGGAGNPTIDISSSYVGQSSITTLGTITTGTWNGGVIPILYGGTGSSTQNFVDLTTDQAVDGIKEFYDEIKVKSNQVHLTSDFLNRGGSVASYGVVSNKLGAGGLILDVKSTGGLYFRADTTRKGLFDTNGLILSSSLGNSDVPTERLDVRGNIRYNTLLKPNNVAGTNGQFLGTSGTQDAWTTLTTSHISNLSSYTGFDNYFTETEANGRFVDFDTDQSINGIKSFADHINIGGSFYGEGIYSISGTNRTFAKISSDIGFVLNAGTRGIHFAQEEVVYMSAKNTGLLIGTALNKNTFASEKLQVNGNIRYDTLLKPNNVAGTAGQFLGTNGTQDAWATLTTSDISNLSSYTGFDARYFTETEADARFAPIAHTLDSHSNVTITSNSSGEILKWNGSAWINNTLAEAGIQPLDDTLTSLAALTVSTGILVQTTGDSQFVLRSITGTADRISVSNGNGGAGNPTIDIASTYVGQTSITTLGIIGTGTWNGTTISTAKGGTGLTALGTAGQLLKVNSGATALEYFTPTYISGNQTITLSGVITGSGTTAITTSIADGTLSIAKTSGLQTALDAKMATASYPDLVAIEALTDTSGFLKKTAANTWALDTNTYLTANQTITLSGDVSGSGTTSITATLATIAQASSGDFRKITLDTKGRVTGNTAVVIGDLTALGATTLTSLSSTATGLTYTNTTGVFSLTSGYSIPTTTNQTNWSTAYGWGNHASAGYLTTATAASTYQPILPSGTAGQFLIKNASAELEFFNLELEPTRLTKNKIAVGDSANYLSDYENFEFLDSRLINILKVDDSTKAVSFGMYGASSNSFISASGGSLTVRGDNGLIFSNFAGGGTLALTVDNDGKVGVTPLGTGGGSTPTLASTYIGYGSSGNALTGTSNFTYDAIKTAMYFNDGGNYLYVGKSVSVSDMFEITAVGSRGIQLNTDTDIVIKNSGNLYLGAGGDNERVHIGRGASYNDADHYLVINGERFSFSMDNVPGWGDTNSETTPQVGDKVLFNVVDVGGNKRFVPQKINKKLASALSGSETVLIL